MIDIFGIELVLDAKLLLVVVAVIAGGLVRGFAGFGSALVIIPPLAILFGPRTAVAIEVILEIPVALSLLPSAVKHAKRDVVFPMIVAILIAIPIGALALKVFEPEPMKIVISIAVLGMVCLLAMQQRITAMVSRRGSIAGGFASGLIQGSTGVGGPPGVIALLSRGDEPAVARGNVIAFMNCMVAISIVSYWAYGFMTREVLVIGLLLSPICVGSVALGMLGFRHFGDRWLRPIALLFVAITAIATLVTTLADSITTG